MCGGRDRDRERDRVDEIEKRVGPVTFDSEEIISNSFLHDFIYICQFTGKTSNIVSVCGKI